MKNIVFDLGGVLFARDKSKCTPELLEFFSFLRAPRMPLFWEEYDRGTSTLEEVTATISGMTGRPVETCAAVLRLAVDLQEPVKPTERLVGDLKAAGYRLYVLSNMSREFIDFLRRFPVYGLFDGEVVSCEEHTVKPEPRIYEILLERYGLTPSETLFIDDREMNIEAAAAPLSHIQNDISAQELQNTGLGAGAHSLTHQLALLEYQQGGDAHYPELRRQIRLLVHVHLAHLYIGALLGYFVHHGAQHPAGAAPAGPEVQQYGLFAVEHFLCKVFLGNVDDCHIFSLLNGCYVY